MQEPVPENLNCVPESQTSHMSAPRVPHVLEESSSLYDEQRRRAIQPDAEYFTQSVIETSMSSRTDDKALPRLEAIKTRP